MTTLDHQTRFAHDVANLISHIFTQGYRCTIGEAFREEVNNPDTNWKDKTKTSMHCDKLAIDLDLFSSSGEHIRDGKTYEKFGVFWMQLDPLNSWGRRDASQIDMNHFERTI